jgi:hypothetical protein
VSLSYSAPYIRLVFKDNGVYERSILTRSGPGEILVRLPTDGAADLTLLRNPQQDMAVAVDSSRTEPGVPDALAELLRTLTNASTIRRLAFNSFKDLHAFQLAVTGFEVKFDGYADQ